MSWVEGRRPRGRERGRAAQIGTVSEGPNAMDCRALMRRPQLSRSFPRSNRRRDVGRRSSKQRRDAQEDAAKTNHGRRRGGFAREETSQGGARVLTRERLNPRKKASSVRLCKICHNLCLHLQFCRRIISSAFWFQECKFGAACYQKSPAHRAKFSHPSNASKVWRIGAHFSHGVFFPLRQAVLELSRDRKGDFALFSCAAAN